MKENLKFRILGALLSVVILLGVIPATMVAAESVMVDFCLTNGTLDNDVFFENDPSKYFMRQYTKADGTLYSLEELYRTDSLDLEFDGWYTEDGEKVTLDTVFTEYTIIYDRWKPTTLSEDDIISELELGTPMLEAGKTAGSYDTDSIELTDDRLTVASVAVYEGLNAYRTNKLDDAAVLEEGVSYSIKVELHTKNGELIDDQLMSNTTASYGLVSNMLYSHDNSGIYTTGWTNRENKIQVVINYNYEDYYFQYDLEDKTVENGQSPQYTVYVSNNANIASMELFVRNANGTWSSLGKVSGQFNIPANSNIVKYYRVDVTYQNGFVIGSNTFKVDWYDPDAPKFVTQPADQSVAFGSSVLVTYGLNFDVSSIQLEKYNGATWDYVQLATPTGVTVTAQPESGTYTYRIHAVKNGTDYYSEPFEITWREKFMFTKQPESGSALAGSGEGIVITWETNLAETPLQTLQVFQLQSLGENGNWNYNSLLSYDATSRDFGASDFAYSKTYRLMANYDGVLYYSDAFTVEYVAGVFTVKPASELNAVINKDLLVEWDFNVDVEYYDIFVYVDDGYDQYERVYQPEHVFNESEVGRKQFLVRAFNAKNEQIGDDYLMFDIVWSEEQVVYLVSFNANGGEGKMTGFQKNAGEEYTLPDCAYTAPSGKQFKAWDVNGVEKNPGDVITVNANTVIKAVWEDVVEYFVVYVPGNGGDGSNDLDYALEGTVHTLKTPEEAYITPQAGKKFAYWSVHLDGVLTEEIARKQPGETVVITGDTYFLAVWEDTAMKGDVDGNGSITNADVLMIYRYIYNSELYPLDTELADVDKNGSITNADVLMIYRYIYNPSLYPLD